jgi:ABC-type sugar transport system permease subunit
MEEITRPPSARAARVPIAGSRWWGIAAAAPAAVLLAIFYLVPAISMSYYSLTDWDGIDAETFVGLDNFAELMTDPAFLVAVKNNLLFALFVPVQVGLSLVVALLIFEHTPGWRVFRGIYFLPVVMSPIVVGMVWRVIFGFDGPINTLLEMLGVQGPNWLAQPFTSIPAIMVIVLWASFGFNMVIYLAALSAISPLLFDAARVDGAGWWATFRSVVAPMLGRTTQLLVVLNLITAFAAMFPYVYVTTAGGPGRDTFVVEFLIYDEGFTFGHVGYGSAISVTLFAIVVVLMLGYLRLIRRPSE